jgi:polyhydroxyalkanoate synthase
MIAYPGRSFGQLYHRFVRSNALSTGRFELGDRTIDLAAISAPVLVFAGSTDGIAPVNAVKAVVPLLTGAAEVRFEIVPGGHLGMLTGRAARRTTWRALDEWLGQWSTTMAATPEAKKVAARKRSVGASATTKTAATKTAAKKAPGKKTATKAAAKKAPGKKTATKTAAKKSAAKRAPVKTTATKRTAAKKGAAKRAARGSAGTIGTNPGRRYGSAGSRGLAR